MGACYWHSLYFFLDTSCNEIGKDGDKILLVVVYVFFDCYLVRVMRLHVNACLVGDENMRSLIAESLVTIFLRVWFLFFLYAREMTII